MLRMPVTRIMGALANSCLFCDGYRITSHTATLNIDRDGITLSVVISKHPDMPSPFPEPKLRCRFNRDGAIPVDKREVGNRKVWLGLGTATDGIHRNQASGFSKHTLLRNRLRSLF
jgi:hypothetical protein